ncbi:MAG: hypothetical protein ACR2M1_04225 [Gemmatimonadaceae bacterium]
MTRVQDANPVAVPRGIPATWGELAAQPMMPFDSVERYRWIKTNPVVSDRALAVTALAVLRDHSDAGTRLHTKATGVLYRAAKLVIVAGVGRLGRYGKRIMPTREDAITAVDDVVAEAIAKTTARSGGEWVTYLAMRINGEVANHLVRGTARQERMTSLGDEELHADISAAAAAPSSEAIQRTVLQAILAITTTDDQRCALEAMFAVGRYKGLPGCGTHSQADAAEVSGLSQQRVSVLRRRMKEYLFDSLGVPQDDDED